MDDWMIIKECNEKTRKMHIGWRYLKPVETAKGIFEDDIVLIAEN